jgi:pimeloyl-ACP methyl ester carboxylesterase
MYRDLINNLSEDYHLIAPDYPGFGNSSFPTKDEFKYTFDNISNVMEKFIDTIGLKNFTLFMQDYGSPVGFRIAARRPELIQALVIQNAIAHTDGIGPNLAAFPPFWSNRNTETEKPLRDFLTITGTKFQYLDGAENPENLNPDGYSMDQFFLDRPNNVEVQLELFFDYQNNVGQFPVWQNYLKMNQPPTLITWGKNDNFFTTAGAEAYKNELEDVEIYMLNSGHFALEEFHVHVALLIKSFLNKKGIK